jgi:aminoglycoside phosphotransferase (APT) family kinase protein
VNTQTQARQILESLGLPVVGLIFATRQGVANDTWLTPNYVVRISKDPEYLEDLFTESVAAPAARTAGVPSPNLIHMELAPDFGEPFSVWAFVPGPVLAEPDSVDDPVEFFANYGRMLRAIHHVPFPDDPNGYLDEAWLVEPGELLESAARYQLDEHIEGLLDRASPATEWCFVHQDLHAENVIVGADQQPVALDWGDAGIGDPAVDFRFIPALYLDVVLAAYGESDPSFTARVLVHQWDQYFAMIRQQRAYGPWGESRLGDLVRITKRVS